MAINWKNGFTPVSELTLDNFPDFAEDYAQYAYMLCYKASLDEKQAVSLSASALAAVACKESGKEGSSSLMPEEAIKRVLLDVLSKQQLTRLNNDDIKTDKTATPEQLDAIVARAINITNIEMPRYARVFSGTKGSLVIIGLVIMLLVAIVLIWVNPFSCSGTQKVVVAGKTGDVSAAAKPDADMLVGVIFDDSGAENVNTGVYPVMFTLDGPDSRVVTDVAVYSSGSEQLQVYPCGEERYCFIASASDVYQTVIRSETGEMSAYHIVPYVSQTDVDVPCYIVSHNDTAEIDLPAGKDILVHPQRGTMEKTAGGYVYLPTDSGDGIGLDFFTYGDSMENTYTVPVLVCNSAPYIDPDSLSAQVKHTPSRSGMIAGKITSSDADNDKVVFELNGASGCSVMLSSDGSYIALIEPDYRLPEAIFSFTVSDGIAVSDPYTVKIALSNNLIAPSEKAFEFVCYSGDDGFYSFELPEFDDDGDRIEWTLVTENTGGKTSQWSSRVAIVNGYMVTYQIDPALNEDFVEALTFSCSDGWTNGSLMTVICNNKENRAPVSSGQNSAVIPANAASLLEVTVRDDCAFDRCAIISIDNVHGGSVSENTGWSDMSFVFTPDGSEKYCSVTLTVADVLSGSTVQIAYDITVE